MRWRLALLAAALGGSGFTVVTEPASLSPILWPSSQATMVLHQAGSADVGDGSDLAAMRDGLRAWSAPGCADFTFIDGGTSGTRGDDLDGVNRISFLESGWPSGASGAVALTTRVRNTATSPDTWSEADIIINGQDFAWSTDGTVQSYDIQTTVTHELGHVLGLQHTPDPEATMYFAARPGLTFQRTLAADDVAGVCFLYPAGAFTCSADTDCPLLDDFYNGGAIDTRTRCDSGGSCVAGAVGYGGDCYVHADCTSGTCLRGVDAPASLDPGACTQSCTVGGSDCPGSDHCDDSTGSPLCYLGHDDCVLHTDCTAGSSHRCEVDLDGRFRCTHRCVQDTHCSVAPGTVCHGGVSNPEPGFCRTPGPGAQGSDCDHGLECQSLYCAGPGVQPTCVGEPLGPGDGGAGPDGGQPGDPIVAGDPLAPGDPFDTGDTTDGDGNGGPDASRPPSVTGGCACRSSASVLAVLAAVPVLLRRRR